jgi:UDP-2-acetamido-3-amino-2,3-dideoxy-glucuronate N-acetyltransferase
MDARLRLAVLGGGYWGRNLIRNFAALEGVEVKLLCELNEEASQECRKLHPALEICTDHGRAFKNNEVDGIVVVTPPSLHYQPAKEALTAGKHTFVEKPMAMSYKEGRELVALAEKEKKVLFVDETFLYDPALQVIKEMLDGGAIGTVYHILMERLGMGRVRCDSNVWWNSAPHDLSILRFLIGRRVQSISLHGSSYLQKGIEDVTLASLELDGDISALIHLSWFHPLNTASLVVIGSTGAIFYEGRFAKRKVILYRYDVGKAPAQQVQGIPSPNFIPIKASVEKEITEFGPEEPLRSSCASFVKAITNGIEPPSSGRNSLQTLQVLEAGVVSLSKGGAKVSLEDVGL